jgi:hypothetical protein
MSLSFSTESAFISVQVLMICLATLGRVVAIVKSRILQAALVVLLFLVYVLPVIQTSVFCHSLVGLRAVRTCFW